MTDDEVRKRFICVDCNVDTWYEYYMIHNHLWDKTNVGDGMLCIGCCETRIGRTLNKNDFPDYPINQPEFWEKTDRLKNRLGV